MLLEGIYNFINIIDTIFFYGWSKFIFKKIKRFLLARLKRLNIYKNLLFNGKIFIKLYKLLRPKYNARNDTL